MKLSNSKRVRDIRLCACALALPMLLIAAPVASALSNAPPHWDKAVVSNALSLAAKSSNVRTWFAGATNSFSGVFACMLDGEVIIALTNGATQVFPLASLPPLEQQAVIAEENSQTPRISPPWLKGFRLRIPLRVLGNVLTNAPKTVLAQIPTGGWLKPDASDLMVQTLSGRTLNPAVISHDACGQTLIQFNRNGSDRWYWLYVMNPSLAQPIEPALASRIEALKKSAEAATSAKMNAQKTTAEKAATVRETSDQIRRDQTTIAKASAEIAEWERLIPEREAAALAAEAKIEPALAAAKALAPAVETSKAAAAKAEESRKNAVAATASARQLVAETMAATKKAASEADAARAAAGKAAPADKPAAEQAASLKAKAASEAQAAHQNAEQALKSAQQNEAAVETASQPPRMAAQKAMAEKAEADRQAATLQGAAKKAGHAVDQAKSARSNAASLKARTEAALQKLNAALPALQTAAEQAGAASARAVEAARAADEALLAVAVEADPSLHREGLSVEFRDWVGDELTDWPTVVAGLNRSDTVVGNGWITEVLQYANPFRRDNPRDFAASFRGSLKIDKPGIYRFFVNSDDAAFLFINNFLVYSRRGANLPAAGRVPIYSVGADIELEAGIHPLEVHQVVGHSPGATGRCTLLWLMPGSKQWTLVPRTAFAQGMPALPVGIEQETGAQAAGFTWGIDDCLSADGITLYLLRFEAVGAITNPERLLWNFGDGTTATGRSVRHVYLRPDAVEVSLASAPGLPPFRRRVTPWTPTAPTSPLSLERAVAAIAGMDIAKLDNARLAELFEFLLICRQPTRRPVIERICLKLLPAKNLDIKLRLLLHSAMMEALAGQGRADEAVARLAPALAEFSRLPSMRVALQAQAADIHWRYRRDPESAIALYQAVLSENHRAAYPAVRQAAIALGDLYMDLEDMPRAAEAFRLASKLGAGGTAQAPDAATRGAWLRVAEQQLKEGNISQTRNMLDRLVSEFPEQKLEGIYRFLRGETDRASGRYEESIRHYEILLKLRQWAGYRPQAMAGLADCFYRLNEPHKSLEWLDELQAGFPAFYEEHKLAEYRNMLQARIQRQENESDSAFFAGFELDFEPETTTNQASLSGVKALPGFGINSPHAALSYTPLSHANASCSVNISNFVAESWFWAEVWYRNAFSTARGLVNPYVKAAIFRADKQRGSEMAAPMDSTYGEWYKAGGWVKAPLAQDGQAVMSFVALPDLFEFDGAVVAPVTDSARENLRLFIEGANVP